MPDPALTRLLALADEALTVEELIRGQRLWTVGSHVPAAEARRALDDHQFTTAPLTGVPIEHYVQRLDLPEAVGGPVCDYARAIDEGLLVVDTAPLSVGLERLREKPFLFVHHRGHITGIITRADAGQPVVTLFTLGLILSTEVGIDQYLHAALGDGCLALLSATRQAKVRKVFQQRKAHDADLDLLHCLHFDDRFNLAQKVGLTKSFGFASVHQARLWQQNVGNVRNHLAHGDSILSALPDPLVALNTIAEMRRVAIAAWAAADSVATSP
jgi:hypothetical protein